MIQTIKPYPDKKDLKGSPFAYLPNHWRVLRLKNVVNLLVSNVDKHVKEDEIPVQLCNYTEVYKNERITKKQNFMKATATAEEIDLFKLRIDDVLITKDSEMWNDIGKPSLVKFTSDNLICGYHLAILRPRKNISIGSFILRVLQAQEVQTQFFIQANGVTRYGLSHSSIKNILLPLPPLDEQHSIVRFLDHADRRIQHFIRAKQKLIKLLNEQKQAIIHQAVTRGLDPKVCLKPSGVDWLGDFPKDWVIRRLKFLVTIKTGGRDTVDRKNDADYPFFVRSQTVERIDTYSFEGEAVLTAGDGAGVAKVFHYINGKFDYHQRVYRFSHFHGIMGKFFFYYFSNTLRFEAFRETAKSTVDSLRLPMLQNFPVVIPPLADQEKIIQIIDQETVKFDSSLAKLKDEIFLIQEYRTRLIADVVTGKLDVREAAASLPEELDESEDIEVELPEEEIDSEEGLEEEA